MSDQIEARLSRYFAQLRPNAPEPAEARLVAALDRAAAERSSGWRTVVAGLSRRQEVHRRHGGRAIAGLGALAVIAIVASLTVRGMSSVGGPGASESPEASGAAASVSPSMFATDSLSLPTPSASPAPGTFTPTGKLASSDVFTATVLLDGRVLIVGSAADSPQLYDPRTGTFARTGRSAMNTIYSTATRLADGRVLFVGGFGSTTTGGTETDYTIATAEIYDPATSQFSLTGSLITARMGHTATLLSDGRVLIAGGSSAVAGTDRRTVPMLASAELYDPKTGEFSATGSMTTGRDNATATLLGNGRVLIAGGGDEANSAVASAELYDPATGKFGPTGSMSAPRFGFNATLLLDGRVLVSAGNALWAGSTGQDWGPPVFTIETYEPKTGKFSPAGSVDGKRAYYTTVVLADGRVLFVGGLEWSTANWGDDVASCVLYDPATGKMTPTGSTLSPVGLAVRLLDGRVLAIGTPGWGPQNDVAQLYQP
jgi:hypothetical protein